MAKTDLYEVTIVTEFIDGTVYPLPKGFREKETFSLNEFYGYDRVNSMDMPEEGFSMQNQHIGSFTTMDKAIRALKEYGVKMTLIDNDSAITEEPIFDLGDDSDDRSITNFIIDKVKVNTLNENFAEWLSYVSDSDPNVDEEHDAFLNALADVCEKYGVERKDMKDFITIHVNDEFEGGN